MLDREINSGRRLGLGFIALLFVCCGGLLLGVGADAMDDDGALAALGFVIGLVLVVPGVLLGLAITRAGGMSCTATAA